MWSWWRIAWRWGDLDAKSSGGAGGASATLGRSAVVVRTSSDPRMCVRRPTGGTPVGLYAAPPSRRLACYPDVLRRPLACPLFRRKSRVTVRLGILRGLDLDEIQHLEAVRAQQPDPVAVTKVELDAPLGAFPLEAMHAEVGAQQPLLGRQFLVRGAEDHERPVRQADQVTPGTEQARGLGNPPVGVGPERGAVLGDGEVEAFVGKRDRLSARFDQRELEATLVLHAARGLELCRCDVDADRARTAPREPRG